MCKHSGGDLLSCCLNDDSIHILRAEIGSFHQPRGLQTPEALFGDHQHLPDHRYCPIDPPVTLGGIGPESVPRLGLP